MAVSTARLPMSNALPSSLTRGPSPPVRQISPCALRPIAADPVPATRTITGPSPAAASAISKSVKILTAAAGNAPASDAFIPSFSSGFPVPANPAHSATTSFRVPRTSCKHISAAFSISRVADSTPTRHGFDGPETLRARIFRAASINTHSVFVPPPSNPSTQRMPQEYVRTSSLYHRRLHRCILPGTLPPPGPLPDHSTSLGRTT